MPKNLLYFVVINILIISLLIWNAYVRFNNYKEHHTILAEESVKALSKEVNDFIKEHKRLVTLFADEHHEDLLQLVRNPEDEKSRQSLEKHLSIFFPDYFAFTIADRDGKPYLDDFDGEIGELCINDISTFSRSLENNLRVHPGFDAYHFDIMTSIKSGNDDLIFFVSFHADTLGRIIRAIEIPQHHLQLVLQNEKMLLEINNRGARNNVYRSDYRLTEQETSRILASTPVDNSSWIAVDAHHPSLLLINMKKNLTEAGIFIFVSIIITAFFYWLIKKEETRRVIAENSRNDFLSIISHELRTPLTSIHGAISLLADTSLKDNEESSKQMLDVAKRNCNQLLYLINEILDFRKIETGKLEYDFQPVELNSIVEDAILNMNDYAKQYNANVKLEKHNKPVYVQADTHRITQVVNNLLSNAIKYGAAGGAVIVNIMLADDFARVNFHDKGPGIPEAFADHVFDKFTQANISGKNSSGSAGLGLNIAKRFIDAHGGHINFTTSAQGTSFYFDLPLTDKP